MADDTNTAERITDEMVHAALKAKNPTLYRDHLRHPSNGPVLSASTENEIQVTRKMLEAAFQAGRASLAASAGSEPVAQLAAERDELFQAAIDFIRTLTGMEPPPIEVAPPEVFAPFREFVNTVQAITDKRHPSPPEGMAGWKWVPVEPTPEMVEVGRWMEYGESSCHMGSVPDGDVIGVWQSMIAAAPPLPASEAKEL